MPGPCLGHPGEECSGHMPDAAVEKFYPSCPKSVSGRWSQFDPKYRSTSAPAHSLIDTVDPYSAPEGRNTRDKTSSWTHGRPASTDSSRRPQELRIQPEGLRM